MTTSDPEGEDPTKDMFGTLDYQASRPPKKEFLPWHRPRKQFVRHFQWGAQINALVADLQLADNTLRYLGLPGNDLLDIRYFHSHICEPKNLKLKFLGFNSGALPMSESQTELNISLDEVRKLSTIDPASEVIWDDFSRMANEKSIAWGKTRDFGPYDVVNLDLCDGFGKHPPGTLEKDTHYSAMARLLSLQARSKNPWLLLLTTRTGQDHTHPDVIAKLIGIYLKNLLECAPFKTLSAEKLSIEDEATLKAAAGTDVGLLPVFLTGLCKWFMGMAISQQPPSNIEVKSVIGYRVKDGVEHEDLVSIALKFEPTFLPSGDQLGLATPNVVQLSECDLSVGALKRVTKRKDADALLEADKELHKEMTAATEKLLELARYDVGAYQQWLQTT